MALLDGAGLWGPCPLVTIQMKPGNDIDPHPPPLGGDRGESSCPWAINDITYIEPHLCGHCPAIWDCHPLGHHHNLYSEKCSGFGKCGLKKLLEQKRETKSHLRDQIIVCHIHFLTSCVLTLLRCTAYPYSSDRLREMQTEGGAGRV